MRFVLIALATLTLSSNAFAAECKASQYGFENCPNDVSHFLDTLEKCHKDSSSVLCKSLSCSYADLLTKYHGQEKMVQMIQASMDDIIGKNTKFNATCK